MIGYLSSSNEREPDPGHEPKVFSALDGSATPKVGAESKGFFSGLGFGSRSKLVQNYEGINNVNISPVAEEAKSSSFFGNVLSSISGSNVLAAKNAAITSAANAAAAAALGEVESVPRDAFGYSRTPSRLNVKIEEPVRVVVQPAEKKQALTSISGHARLNSANLRKNNASKGLKIDVDIDVDVDEYGIPLVNNYSPTSTDKNHSFYLPKLSQTPRYTQ
jgi:hypothetical protein